MTRVGAGGFHDLEARFAPNRNLYTDCADKSGLHGFSLSGELSGWTERPSSFIFRSELKVCRPSSVVCRRSTALLSTPEFPGVIIPPHAPRPLAPLAAVYSAHPAGLAGAVAVGQRGPAAHQRRTDP